MGRTPWSAADAHVGLCSKCGSRGTRADLGVRPTLVSYEPEAAAGCAAGGAGAG